MTFKVSLIENLCYPACVNLYQYPYILDKIHDLLFHQYYCYNSSKIPINNVPFTFQNRSDSIHTATYEGKDHREILRGHEHLSHPFAISLFESHVYWTDWRSNAVLRADKWKAENVEVIDKVFKNKVCCFKEAL